MHPDELHPKQWSKTIKALLFHLIVFKNPATEQQPYSMEEKNMTKIACVL